MKEYKRKTFNDRSHLTFYSIIVQVLVLCLDKNVQVLGLICIQQKTGFVPGLNSELTQWSLLISWEKQPWLELSSRTSDLTFGIYLYLALQVLQYMQHEERGTYTMRNYNINIVNSISEENYC